MGISFLNFLKILFIDEILVGNFLSWLVGKNNIIVVMIEYFFVFYLLFYFDFNSFYFFFFVEIKRKLVSEEMNRIVN